MGSTCGIFLDSWQSDCSGQCQSKSTKPGNSLEHHEAIWGELSTGNRMWAGGFAPQKKACWAQNQQPCPSSACKWLTTVYPIWTSHLSSRKISIHTFNPLKPTRYKMNLELAQLQNEPAWPSHFASKVHSEEASPCWWSNQTSTFQLSWLGCIPGMKTVSCSLHTDIRRYYATKWNSMFSPKIESHIISRFFLPSPAPLSTKRLIIIAMMIWSACLHFASSNSVQASCPKALQNMWASSRNITDHLVLN